MIKKLEPTERVTPTRINQLIEDVERQTRITLGPGLVGTRSSAGTAISSTHMTPPPQDHDIIYNDAGNWGTAHDEDEYGILGRAWIGYNGTDIDCAGFGHIDERNATDYALMQRSVGGIRRTYINTPTSGRITFSINSVEHMRLDATDLRYEYNQDEVAYFGRAAIGYNGNAADSDWACFAHLDNMDSNSYALMQESSGDTYINAHTGHSISFRIEDVEYASILDAGDFHVYTGMHIEGTGGPGTLTVDDVIWAGEGGNHSTTHCISSSADSTTTDGAGFFETNRSGAGQATVYIWQNHLGGGQPCLTLDQDDSSEGFIDFLGSDRGVITGATNSVESVRVELNGTVRRLALYADA
jgi:hypothetical protein